jgi:hypothetical protein
MDEIAYARHIRRANEAEFIYKTIRELYGWEIPWNKSYFMAIKDRILYPEEKKLVKEFYPVR